MKQYASRACLCCDRLRRPPRSVRVPDWQRPFFQSDDPLWRDSKIKL